MTREEVRDRAMNEAFAFEVKRGQTPRKCHHDKCGYDIESDDRKIEVKGRTGTDNFVSLCHENVQAAIKEADFWLYIVRFDDKGKVTIATLDKNEVEERRRLREQWDIPIRKSDFQNMPDLGDASCPK